MSTIMIEKYDTLKAKHPDAVLLFRVGDFYESYKEDAETISRLSGVTLHKRMSDDCPVVWFPHHALETYLSKLFHAGYRVAIGEQLDNEQKPACYEKSI